LSPATGWDFEMESSKKVKNKVIFLELDKSSDLKAEGYKLTVNNQKIVISANDGAGIFYGIQTLLQLFPVEIYDKQRQKNVKWNVHGVEISDAPSYIWRGMMLDVGRYFFEKEYIFHFIDMMAMYKLNILHMHLTEDSGWRLEIKKYPKLTSIGAWRGENEKRTGGYYTQKDIKEIVAYASSRNIEIIPEIDMPAHALAAIAAYPYLSCTGKSFKVPLQQFISHDILCVGKESTFEFIEDVLKETFALFPSKYIHIGGDEAKYDRWEVCPYCQKRKKELGLNSEKELRVYFNKRIQKIAKKYGKTIVGWDEIIEKGGLTEKAVGMVWHNKKKAILGAKTGHDLVMALTSNCYFDTPESKTPGEVKAATWLPPITLKKAYEWDPMIDGLDSKYRSQILGGEGCLWSDQFINGSSLQRIDLINENRAEKYIDYHALPRMAALAEVCWTPHELRNWDRFENDMYTHYSRYDHAGYGYRVPEPKLISKKKKGAGYEIILENVVEGAKIRYSIDGVRPNVHSTIYTKPFVVENLGDFQAITVLNHHQFSLPLYLSKAIQ